jgi:DUF971 family protein
MLRPEEISAVGEEIAIRWSDSSESYLKMDFLRSRSPSAENIGEYDLVGRPIIEPKTGRDFRGVTVTGWSLMGAYAVQFEFSDGHRTGLYSFDYLRELGAVENQALPGGS